MTLLPIVARELRVASRRAATYWTRFTFAMLAVIVGSFAWAIVMRQSPRETGLALFITFSVVAYVYSLIAGALWTADCVSEEKREGTLGLLFLTDLKSYDIVFGKLAASSVTAVYGLLAIFPVMAIPLLLGGVAIAEFWRVVLVCLNNLFLSLALGLLCSAMCKDERKSIGLSLLIIALLTAGWPALIAWIASNIPNGHPFHQLFNRDPFPLMIFCPGMTCVFAFDEPYNQMLRSAKFNWFYPTLAGTHALGWIALLLTMFILPRVWQDKAASAKTLRRREQWQLLTAGPSDARATFRRRLLEINPFYWLASRERFKVVLVWLWMGAGAALWVFGLVKAKRDWLDPGTYMMTAVLLHSFFKCWIAMEASRRLGLDRRSGALELLLCTPLSVKNILHGQWLALLRQFGPAVALVCVADALFLGLGIKHSYSANDRNEWIAIWLAGLAMFLLDLAALTLLSMWMSLKNRKPTQAGLIAIVRVCIIPWALFGMFGAVVAILDEVFRIKLIPGSREGMFFLSVWFIIGLGNSLLLAITSLRNLSTQFRICAMDRSETRAPFWRRWMKRTATESAK
jgi:ABC-type transport system involved in multi-copper enzyme maturation permease subunit